MPQLAENYKCTGCSACAAACPKGCITMISDADGFRFPQVEESRCISCGLCERVCPVLQPPKLREPLPEAYAAFSHEESMRLHSSSGGIFTELAREILAQGGAVYGAAYDDRFKVTHIAIAQEPDLCKLRGAKYSQSELGNTFPEIKARLDNGQPVLFSGTPCQVAGLKAFLGKEQKRLITVDFVCHGVPSPMAWQAYVNYRAEQDNGGILPQHINLRSKETGWSRYRYSNLFQYPDGACHTAGSGQSLFMKLFVGDYINRESCASCPFKGYSRVSDLTIGDFWGIWDIAPDMDDDKGTSLVLVQSEKGRTLLEAIQGRCAIRPVTLEQASVQNPSMLVCSPANPRRWEALTLIRSGRIQDCVQFFPSPKISLLQRVKRKAAALLTKK